jgi:hypothetical protein
MIKDLSTVGLYDSVNGIGGTEGSVVAVWNYSWVTRLHIRRILADNIHHAQSYCVRILCTTLVVLTPFAYLDVKRHEGR